MLNGEPFELEPAQTVADLLAQLSIDRRRVAVEHNLTVLRKTAYDTTEIRPGDQIEIVNFVGGGQ